MNNKHPEPGTQPVPGTPEPGGVPPEETPQGEGGLSGAGPRETYNPAKGWGVWPLIVLMAVVVLFAVFFIVGYATR
ncbi:DUF6480 family protein [Streptomyces sp. 7N604]|uniref:DUF6480 family protein n=1 Tax=Streptomyces sp. 7N604 TaxID=3457415 RepID=UPI003FD2B04B